MASKKREFDQTRKLMDLNIQSSHPTISELDNCFIKGNSVYIAVDYSAEVGEVVKKERSEEVESEANKVVARFVRAFLCGDSKCRYVGLSLFYDFYIFALIFL